MAAQYGRYCTRRITALLHAEDWVCNHKRVERVWRAEGLTVAQPQRGRLWLNDGWCLRPRPQHANHVWTYDFVENCTCEGRKLGSTEVPDARASSGIDVLTDLFITRGTPAYICSDNGREFVATAVKAWITGLGARPA